MLNPVALWFLLLIPPVILLYFLRLRRKERTVSSTMLWEHVVHDLQANVPFQKLRRNLLLLLQIIILIVLVGVLVRPFLKLAGLTGDNLVLVMDASASMQSTDEGGSRLRAAQSAANKMIDDLSRRDQAMVIEAGARTRVRSGFSADKRQLKAAVNAIRAGDVRTNLRDALVLALSLSRGRKDIHIYLFSDGAFDPLEDLQLGNAQVHFVKLGKRCDNAGLTALDVRKTFTEKAGYEVFAGISNFSGQLKSCNLELYRDGALFDVRPVTIPAQGSTGVAVSDLPFEQGLIEARLDLKDDLKADNAAFAYLAEQRDLHVLLIGRQNFFLEKVLNADPKVHLTKGTLGNYGANTGYDVIVFDGRAPDQLYPGSYFLINCAAPGGPVRVVGDAQDPTVLDWEHNHPITKYANFGEVAIAECLQVELEPWAKALVRAETTPLVVLGEKRNLRVIFLGFDLQHSNLPLRAAFPIFMANSLGWLARDVGRQVNVATRTGQAVPLDVQEETSAVEVQTPDRRTVKVPTHEGQALFDETDLAGPYKVTQGEHVSYFVANLLDRRESNTMPRERLELGRREIAATGSSGQTNREIWRWLALLALGVLCAEWFVYHRRL